MAKEGVTYADIRSALDEKKFSPVYLLYGEEDFLIEEITDAIIEAALSKDERGFNLDVMYGNESDAKDVIGHASSFPMGAERRVVVVREADKLVNGELLAHYVDEPSPTTCLVLACVKPDFRKKPFSSLKKKALAVEFKPLWENQAPSWIVRRVKKDKHEIHPDAAVMLTTYVGTSLRELASELEKLYIYLADRTMITADDVATVVSVSKEFSVFELQWAIGSKDRLKATETLERMIQQGGQPVMIVAVLTKFFQNLWKIHDLKRRGSTNYMQAGIYSFIEQYSKAAARFSTREVEDAFLGLADVDEKLKSISADPKLLLQIFVVDVTSKHDHEFA